EFGVDIGMGEQGFWLGAPDELAAEGAVVERLFAKAVAGDDELFAARVPERKGVHAVDVLEQGVAVFLVEMREDLGVGLGGELVAFCLELRADLAVVVQLAVHHDDDGTVAVEYG